MDTTFFRRDFAVLVLMDSNTPEVVSHYFVKTEKDIYYKLALNRLREKGYIIQSITCDGRLGLLKYLFDTPTQMCQFHMIAIVMRKLKRKHRSLAGKELVKTLTKSNKSEFYKQLHQWYEKHQVFLNERSEKPNEKGYSPYKHRELRGAYASLKRYKDYLFTFEKYADLKIERTTNRVESLFKVLKQKLNNHKGLTRKHKLMFIKDFLNKKSW